MKTIELGLICLVTFATCALQSGCATAPPKEFDSSKVGQIQKGTTTTSELTSWFGEPGKKEVTSTGEVKWYYKIVSANAASVAQVGAKRVIRMTGLKKNLTLLIKGNVVASFTFHEEPYQEDHTMTGIQIN